MDKQRAVLIEAMVRKAVALGKLRCLENVNAGSTDDQLREEMHKLYLDLGKFADYVDLKVRQRSLNITYFLCTNLGLGCFVFLRWVGRTVATLAQLPFAASRPYVQIAAASV